MSTSDRPVSTSAASYNPIDLIKAAFTDRMKDGKFTSDLSKIDSIIENSIDSHAGVRIVTVTDKGILITSWIWSIKSRNDPNHTIIPGMPVLDGARVFFISTHQIAKKMGYREGDINLMNPKLLPFTIADIINSMVPELLGKNDMELNDLREGDPMQYYNKNEQTTTELAKKYSTVVYHTGFGCTPAASPHTELLVMQGLDTKKINQQTYDNPNTDKYSIRTHPPLKESARGASEQTFLACAPSNGLIIANSHQFASIISKSLVLRNDGMQFHGVKRESFPFSPSVITAIYQKEISDSSNTTVAASIAATYNSDYQSKNLTDIITSSLTTALGQQGFTADAVVLEKLLTYVNTYVRQHANVIDKTLRTKSAGDVEFDKVYKRILNLNRPWANSISQLTNYFHGNWMIPYNQLPGKLKNSWKQVMQELYDIFVVHHGVGSTTGARVEKISANSLLDYTLSVLKSDINNDTSSGILVMHAIFACMYRYELGSTMKYKSTDPRNTIVSMQAASNILLCSGMNKNWVINNNNNNNNNNLTASNTNSKLQQSSTNNKKSITSSINKTDLRSSNDRHDNRRNESKLKDSTSNRKSDNRSERTRWNDDLYDSHRQYNRSSRYSSSRHDYIYRDGYSRSSLKDEGKYRDDRDRKDKYDSDKKRKSPSSSTSYDDLYYANNGGNKKRKTSPAVQESEVAYSDDEEESIPDNKLELLSDEMDVTNQDDRSISSGYSSSSRSDHWSAGSPRVIEEELPMVNNNNDQHNSMNINQVNNDPVIFEDTNNNTITNYDDLELDLMS